MESESRIAKIYGPKCPGFNEKYKTRKKKKSLIYTWEKKKSAEIVSDSHQMLELTDEYFKLVIINMLK